jgi:hypothetical protein
LIFGLEIIILQGVSRRKSLAGVNIMGVVQSVGYFLYFGRYIYNVKNK